jgi:hypothetical protein
MLTQTQAWYDASATNLAHISGARSLFQEWMADEGMLHHDTGFVPLKRRQSFIVGAMAYLESLGCFIADRPLESLAYLRRFGMPATGHVVYPNPWTGVSTALYVHLADTATLMRYKRAFTTFKSFGPQTMTIADMDAKICTHARHVYEQVLACSLAPKSIMEDTRDINTPLDHLISMNKVHRLVILLELVQAFPELAVDRERYTHQSTESKIEARRLVVDLAIAILNAIADIPETSGAITMLSIPLIAAGSALQAPQMGYLEEEHTRAPGLHELISAETHRRPILQMWRDQARLRLEQTRRRIGLAPLGVADQLLQAVWIRADNSTADEGSTAVFPVHWMDIMIEENLETLLG